MSHVAKYNLGDIVVHKKQGYRAVIVDIDPLFQASGQFNPGATGRPFANQHPWYRLLIDDSSQMTYVEEPFLSLDISEEPFPIENPLIEDYRGKTFH